MLENLSVVIVEDNPLQLVLLERTLQNLGVQKVQSFDNGLEALSWFASHHVDTLVCDLQMPELDGIDLLISLNEQEFKGNVVILSGMESSVTTTVKAMCNTFSFNVVGQISKLHPRHLSEQLSNLLSLTTQISTQPVAQKTVVVSEADFLVALAQGQIINYYQPLIDFNSNDIVGVEALARWEHPIHGVLPPALFMPIVERCDLSNELFDTVFGNAIIDIQQSNLTYRVSLNVDHTNLKVEKFSDVFLARCFHQEVAPTQFAIEITETDSYKDSIALYRNLSKLRINGVGVSIDDFGVGHSSLKKLSMLPFNQIKIDRSFVKDLIFEPKKNQIVQFICGLAKSLAINVVVEGVEDQSTWRILKSYGVDICQGFYHYKPMSIEDLVSLQYGENKE
ncbi:EAL domain-containing response regulator [Vibrio crassostreae]|uniref:EAL domain-containing response regulator n=1 Tax=Vibrio crassostreae TaxID=246167 RepID=UPI001B312AAC|nr:EAL domain-containing response regulator [Vibrio crassostreae]CAK3513355.1 Diguanylate phosphodiesterase [Vibrio crassostreae]CAK3515901.1 Diguanylate phosphodiesterase [Vibrio crassostreae]CAK3912832.1 Diguanylate phosphodiesterase [Vibrio crassostreae]